ncbi:MAG: T9SS type A sorting domain-containing protein [Chitinophagales bacterium]|nr:T9SS type A sorting domain-containing protein [Chitinophagales bacterium]MDW8418895.1 T9SS type A sorting domain-containing protein [Chitinophagales bacterium]
MCHKIRIATLVLSIVLSGAAGAQSCADCRYLSPVFDSVKVSTEYFARGVKANGDTLDMYMDIYEPAGDTAVNRPVMIFAFGGGFVQGSRTDWYVVEVCRHFARTGYVAVSIDYRTGITTSEIISLQFMRIFFRPMQEMRAAVQHLKWSYAEDGNPYRIDTSRIIIGGASAGAITALMTAYCDKPGEIDDMGNISALDALGGFYSTSGFHQHYNWQVAGVVNVSGALVKANWIEPGDVPVISAHGDADNVVPYKEGAFAGLSIFGFNLQGSYIVDTVARNRGVCSYLYTMEGRGHPDDEMGIEYIRSVVYRISQRMYALIHGRSYCCPLAADITPQDTLFFAPGAPDVTLTAVITNDNGNAQPKWCSIGCGVSASSNSVTFTPDTSLRYMLLSAIEGGCEAADIHILVDTTALYASAGNATLPELTIYPNPADQYLIIRPAPGTKIFNLEISDLHGIIHEKYSSYSASGEMVVDVSRLASGAYVLKWNNGRKNAYRKIIIQHP